jgi:hypothetical protein
MKPIEQTTPRGEFKLPLLQEAVERLDKLFDEAFGIDHPAMQDWVAIKFALKEKKNAK